MLLREDFQYRNRISVESSLIVWKTFSKFLCWRSFLIIYNTQDVCPTPRLVFRVLSGIIAISVFMNAIKVEIGSSFEFGKNLIEKR